MRTAPIFKPATKHMMSFEVSSFSTLFLKALAGQTSQLELEDGQITEIVWQAT